jgi:DNA polymerase elongation subunit (family B)
MVHHLHNTVINVENININTIKQDLCNRNDLLDPKDVKLIENKVKNNDNIIFLGNDLSEGFPSRGYKLVIYGILPCGSKVALEINDIEPYIDIQGDNNLSRHINMVNTRSLLLKEKLEYSDIEVNKGKPFILYNEQECYFIRIYFKTIKNRKDAIQYFHTKKVTTYNNDISCYYRVVARDYKINLTSWNIISNYKTIFNSYVYKSKYHIKVSINDIKPYENTDYINFTDIPKHLLQLDKSISMCFDIEAYTGNTAGDMPSGKNEDDILFMLCMTYQFINSKNYLLNICLVTNDCAPQEDLFTIVCNNESNLIKLFAILNELIQPEYITEFNGSEFDWPFLMEKAEMFGLVLYLAEHMSIKKLSEYELNKEQILKWKYKEERVKAEADRYVISRNLNLQGYLPFDTRIVFKQLYPTESKSSLNHYLSLNNLGSKDDMSIAELFRIYREGTAEEMKLVAHYCFIDSWKLHLLNIKKNIIQDKREVCKLSYTSIFDGFYRANGLKVRNLIISKAILKNLYINNHRPFDEEEEEEKGKYPGAIVLNPTKGLVSPVYNIHEFNQKIDECNKITENQLFDTQIYINKNYENLYIKKEIVYDNLNEDLHNFIKLYTNYLKKNEFQYPISGLDFSSLYPSLIMAYNLSPEFLILDENYANKLIESGVDMYKINFQFNEKPVNAWTVRHDETKEKSNFGLYPSILKFLFNERNTMKKDLFKYKELKEHMELLDNYENNTEYADCMFNLSYVDSKQKALKVFMNTFYGELGNQRSPLFTLPLAGGVTSSGQYNLMMIHKHVSKRKCRVYYGDSVRGDTPILIKQNDIIKLLPMEEIGWKQFNIEYQNEKEIIYDNQFDKIEVYSENGWTPIKKMIRHYTTKELYRVTTHTGSIIVTEDHSLLTKDKQEIAPSDCKIGMELLHWDKIDLSNFTINGDIKGIIQEIYRNGYIDVDTQIDMQFIILILIKYNLNFISFIIKHINNKYRMEFPTYKIANINEIIKIENLGTTTGYVYDFETESHHFAAGVGKMVVHNTDSLYISCPEKCFLNLNKKYYTQELSKEEYCIKLVEKTFKAIDIIKDEVNTILFNDNKTKYLKMAYEEVLFPVVFLAKKKYYGVPHEGMVNFNPKDLFIRGLEVKKRGVSELLRKVCLEIMWASCSLKNVYNIRELVEKKIHYVFNNKWDINDFVQTAVWKPEKQNITINVFVEHMRNQGKKLPEPYERFKFVVTKKYPYKYDLKGRQIELKKGDKIEYLETAITENLEIDLNYYFEGELTGQFARLISYDKDLEEYTDIGIIDDDKTFKNCQKHILELANQYNNKFINRGKIYKDIYRNVNKKINNKKIYNNKVDFLVNIGNNLPEINIERTLIENIINYSDNMYNYENMSNNIIKGYKKNDGSKKYLHHLHNLYSKSNTSYYSKMEQSLDVEITDIKSQLMKILMEDNLYKTIFSINNINIEKIINYIKEEYNLTQMCKDNDSSICNLTDICEEDDLDDIINNKDLYQDIDMELVYKLYTLIIKLISIYSRKKLNNTIFNNNHRKICVNKNTPEPPSSFDKNAFIFSNY